MVSQHDEQQGLLASEEVGDHLHDEERTLSYNTFDPDAAGKATQHETPIPKASKTEVRDYTWKTIVMIMSTWIGIFLASVDMSVMSTLTGPISESLSSFQLMTWFINAYMVTSALIQPLSGKLSDIYGRRNCLLLSNLAFLLGNLGCGLSTKPWHFILARAIGGLGGGCLHSIATFLASDVIPLRARGFWQGMSNVAFGVGFALGGVVGGVVSDSVGWQWAFLFQPVPILVSMVFVYFLVPKSTTGPLEPPSLKRIDFLGSLTLTLAILTLMFGAVSGGNTFPWSSPYVYVPLIVSPFLFALFAYIEIKVAREPIIPVRSLADRTVLGACLTNFLDMVANTGFQYYVPMALETQGLSPSQAGSRLIPSAVGSFIGSVVIGALMNKTGKYYWLLMFTQVELLAGALGALLSLDTLTGWQSYLFFLFNGTGIGGMLVTTLLALISAGDHTQHAVLTSASYAFRTAGQTMGTTIAGAIFQNLFTQQLWDRLGDKKDADMLIPAIRRRQIGLDSLPAGWRSQVLESYNISFHAVFAFILAAYILGTITASVIREHELHSTLKRK